MTYKDMVALMVFIVVLFAMMMTFAILFEHKKCDHVEVGQVTHNPYLK